MKNQKTKIKLNKKNIGIMTLVAIFCCVCTFAALDARAYQSAQQPTTEAAQPSGMPEYYSISYGDDGELHFGEHYSEDLRTTEVEK